ncbi:hypothetical protein, partial [Bilophila wadsworthia]|uniref:hypothetical protein n=1 Tax=Bilophila wadsworthia TaxID=35833 RepID=UPI003AB43C1D
VEYEDLRQLHNKNNYMLGCLLPSCDSAYYELMPDRLIWTLDRKTTHTSLIEFIQNILNINWLDALATLADILGMNYENIFSFRRQTLSQKPLQPLGGYRTQLTFLAKEARLYVLI